MTTGERTAASLGGPHNYANNPDFLELSLGIGNFDVTSANTANAAIWLCDSDTSPNWGIWMYHLKNGASDTNDIGTQAVTTGGDLNIGSTGGCMIDSALDIFCAEALQGENPVYSAMVFTNWNLGVLPPESGGTNFATGTESGEVAWGYGCGVDSTCATNPTFEQVEDVAVNSRTSPTIVAFPMGAGNEDTNGSGIRLLDAHTGAIVESNLDFNQQYTCAAWDNVGNLYAASISRNVWRAWSPPGPGTNTTLAVATIVVGIPLPAASATIYGVAAGNSYDYTITLKNTGSIALNSFWYGWTTGGNNLALAPSSAGNSLGWSNDLSGTSIKWTNGTGTALAPGASATFTFVSTSLPSAITTSPSGESVAYVGGIDFTEGVAGDSTAVFSPTLVAAPSTTQPLITRATRSGGVVTINFTGSSTAAASDFVLQGSTSLNGVYTQVAGAVVTGSAGAFSVSTTPGATIQFYRISAP